VAAKKDQTRPWYIEMFLAVASAIVGGVFTLVAKESTPAIYTMNACQLSNNSLSVGTCVGCLGGGTAYGKCVVTNQDATPRANQVDWRFAIKETGYYRIVVTYAALESRPVRLFANGELINETALAKPTGGWT
jgi:hypothetical protein